MRKKQANTAGAILASWLLLASGWTAAEAATSYLDNGTIKIGIDLDRGGAISYLNTSGGWFFNSVVNTADLGRYIQTSYYSGPQPFIPPGATQHPGWAG